MNTTATTLPKAIVIGPAKAGTTWIHEYLGARGDVGIPMGVKETFFFDRYFSRGMDWYARHFKHCQGKSLIVEAAPTYFQCLDAPQRIMDNLGSIPLVTSLRHPAKRAYSHYLHLRRFGVTRAEFRRAVEEHPVILDASRYGTHLTRWIQMFGRDRICVLFLDTLVSDPNEFARTLVQHLGLPFETLTEEMCKPANEAAVPYSPGFARIIKSLADTARYYGLYQVVSFAKSLGLKEMIFGKPGSRELPKLSEEDEQWFLTLLVDEMSTTEELLGVDLSHWKPKSTGACKVNREQVCSAS